jgi:16S rRNA (uracil1498-N3)-methyltransferase
LAAAAEKRTERWRRLAAQASEQSRRVAPPEICMPLSLDQKALAISGTRIVLAESERRISLKAALRTFLPLRQAQGQLSAIPAMEQQDEDSSSTLRWTSEQMSPELALALGPEGGWTEPELRWFSEAGWTQATLGMTILRAETAAIAALAIVMSELFP